jgi:predicted DNA-binding transcriptional regulator YafY
LRAFSPAAAEAAVDVAGNADPAGWRTVDVPIESLEDAAGWLLRLGPEAEAMSPPALRVAVVKAARAVLDRYEPRQAAG